MAIVQCECGTTPWLVEPAQLEVSHNADESRFELSADGEIIGIADYRLIDDDVAMFHHTVVTPPLRGRGHGRQLVREALDDVRRRGLRVRAVCWYVDQFKWAGEGGSETMVSTVGTPSASSRGRDDCSSLGRRHRFGVWFSIGLFVVLSASTATVATAQTHPLANEVEPGGTDVEASVTTERPGEGAAAPSPPSLEQVALLPEEDDRVVHAAMEQWVFACMAERGFDYPVEPYPAGGWAAAASRPDYPDPGDVARYGFAWPQFVLDHPPVAPAGLVEVPRFLEALGAVPDGCRPLASSALHFDTFEQTQEVFFAADADIWAEMFQTDAYRDAQADAAECFRENGYDAADGHEMDLIAAEAGNGDFTAPEAIAVAQVYYRCAEQAGEMEVIRQIRQDLSLLWIEQHPGALEAWNAARARLVDTALDYLESIES